MSATTLDSKTIDEVLARLEHEHASLPNPEDLWRQFTEAEQKRDALAVRMRTIRSAVSVLNSTEPEITAVTEWLEHLKAWDKQLSKELAEFPADIRDTRELGKRQNVRLSIVGVVHGRFGEAQREGWLLETLRLGDLMRESGFKEGPKDENQFCGSLPWCGGLIATEERLQTLQAQRDQAQTQLDAALRGSVG
jgi:hypothetical protein